MITLMVLGFFSIFAMVAVAVVVIVQIMVLILRLVAYIITSLFSWLSGDRAAQ